MQRHSKCVVETFVSDIPNLLLELLCSDIPNLLSELLCSDIPNVLSGTGYVVFFLIVFVCFGLSYN